MAARLYNVKVPNFTFCRGREHETSNFLFQFRNFDTPLKSIASIWRIKRDGISAVKFEAAQFHFLSDVFVVVPLPLLKFPKTVGFMQLLAPRAAQTWSLHSVIKLETEKND